MLHYWPVINLLLLLLGVMNTTGGIIHDQAETDTNASVSERIDI